MAKTNVRLNFNMTMSEYFKTLVESGGGEFVRLENNAVYFRKSPGEPIVSLYPASLRSALDVELALKSVAERKKAAMWEFAPGVKEHSNNA